MPRIVYFSWPAGGIAGGIKAIFQHVELLNASGLQAVVATADGVRPPWFETPVPMITPGDVQDSDVLVFPENHAGFIEQFAARPSRKAVFCQNPLFASHGLNGRGSYADSGVTHILGPSLTVLQFCERRFPGMKLGYTPFFIDHEVFTCPPQKTLQIACVPRKRQLEMPALIDSFRAFHPQFRALEWQVLDSATEAMVARVMGESAVFLSLARFEAHGMTVLEAMACGCIVAGFGGVAGPGGNDSATAANGFWAAEDDITGCVDQLARAVQLAVDRGERYQAMVAAGSRTARAYAREETAHLVLGFWKRFLG